MVKFWYLSAEKICLVFGFCGYHLTDIDLVSFCHFSENGNSSVCM